MDHGLPEAATDRLNPAGRFGLREALVGVAIALVGVPFGLLLHQVTTDGPLTQLDESLAEWLHARIVHDDVAQTAMRVVSFTGTVPFLTVFVGVPVVWLWRRRARKLVVFLVTVSIGGGIVDSVVKAIVGRPRPQLEEPIATAIGKSFPSGHSMSSLICYGAVLLVFIPLIAPRWRPLAIGLTAFWVLAIGLSRLALGVHFLSDVLGGYVLGAAWLVGSVAAFEVWREERGQRTTEPLEEGLEPEETRALDA